MPRLPQAGLNMRISPSYRCAAPYRHVNASPVTSASGAPIYVLALKNVFRQRPPFGMTDRWAGRTVLRGSWLQFEAVELPGPVAHGGHGAEPLWAACTLIRT